MNKKIIIIITTLILISCYLYAQSLQKENYDLKVLTQDISEPIITEPILSEPAIHDLNVNSNITNIVTPITNIDNQLFIKVANEFPNIDSGFAYAIHRLETGNGNSLLWVENNNAGGLRGKRGYYTYENKEQGYRALYQLLNKYITEYDLKTPLEVGSLWCNEEWSYKVVKIWKEINSYE